MTARRRLVAEHEGSATAPARDDGSAPPDSRRLKYRHFIAWHQRSILAGWVVLMLCLIVLAAEGVLRLTASYQPNFYTPVMVSNRLNSYSFGDIPFNSYGYPDREWDLANPRERIGFWGDSITSGVGAGFGFRYTDIVRELRRDHDYLNFGGPGEDGIADDAAIGKILALVQRFQLKKVVYAMDLNDILPDKTSVLRQPSQLRRIRPLLKRYVDFLRTRSYLYYFLRLKLSSLAARMGYGYHGDEMYELHPVRNAAIVNQTVERINKLSVALRQNGAELCVLLFPYEMQVSADAAARYQRDGIRWSSELLAGEPQKTILRGLNRGITAVDVAAAFHQDPNAFLRIGVGEYFVFKRGDVLDWIHPNRAGHRLIAEYLVKDARSCL
jgi:hypothetical protein